MELKEKIIAAIDDEMGGVGWDLADKSPKDIADLADAILAIPEIAYAIEVKNLIDARDPSVGKIEDGAYTLYKATKRGTWEMWDADSESEHLPAAHNRDTPSQ